MSCDTWLFVYVLANVMCLCVYVSMVCQRCMLYDDMYSHDNNPLSTINDESTLDEIIYFSFLRWMRKS
jgi:hypothetical protein